MANYQVKAKNKRGYTVDSEIYTNYSNALAFALECLESNQYSAIVITKESEQPLNVGKFFLHRIIK